MKLFIKLLSSISLSEFILIVQTTILFLEYRLKIIDRKRKTPSTLAKILGVYLSTTSRVRGSE